MISTVTTTSVATITSIATAGSLAVVGILMLLVQKDLASAPDSRYARALSRIVNVAIVPLLLGFAYIVAVKVIEAL